jgi:lysozyme
MTQVFPRVVDLSHHNTDDGSEIDYRAVKRDGIWGVIYKATEGDDYVDETYDEARRQARAAGLLWGAYHFFRPGNVEDQVQHFLINAMPGPGTLLVLDHEDPGCSLDDVKKFLALVEAITGQRPALYSGHVLKEQIGNRIDSFLASTRLWLAQYGPELEWPQTWNHAGVWLWQYTDGEEGPQPHSVDGIGHCDINSFDGTQQDLKATWAETRFPPPQPEPPRPPMPGEVPSWLQAMRAITGMTEASGSADNPRILHMADTIGKEYPHQKTYADSYKHDDTPWCGLTVGYCMTLSGIEPVFGATDTDRWMWALAWSEWEDSILLDEPRLGCVVVMEREGGGHVTLFEKEEGGLYHCRGGNQSDMVNVSTYDPSTVVALVWPRERAHVQVKLDHTESAWLQASLNVLGNAGLEIDGELGPLSREAIAEFQLQADLPATGLADKKTVAVMLADLESWNNARPPRKR